MSASFLRELQALRERIEQLERIVAQLQARPKPGRPPKSQ